MKTNSSLNAPFMLPFSPGSEIEVIWPFVREEVNLYGARQMSWRPGVRRSARLVDAEHPATADALGVMILSVVSVHRPGHFPTRVFYCRRWRAPDGREFGKVQLRIESLGSFRRRAKGYRVPFRLAGDADEIQPFAAE